MKWCLQHLHMYTPSRYAGVPACTIDGACRIYRTPSLACAAAVAARQVSSPADAANQAVHAATSVDISSTVYMVNPAGDLSSTQATFEETFKQQKSWQVT